MKWLDWLTGPKLPPRWDRDTSIFALLDLAQVDATSVAIERAGELYDARIGDTRPPLEVAVEIVETLRHDFS